jgi:hypothetical protein
MVSCTGIVMVFFCIYYEAYLYLPLTWGMALIGALVGIVGFLSGELLSLSVNIASDVERVAQAVENNKNEIAS